MHNKSAFPILVLLALVLSACNLSTTTTPPAVSTDTVGLPTLPPVTSTVPATAAIIPSDTPPPTSTSPASTATLAPTNTSNPVVNPTLPNYIDDRSTPSQVLVSLYNAINRQEYLRAYSYWSTPSTSLGSFSSYANGYTSTASVDLVFGQISGDAGMSQVYYTIPVILKATAKNGTLTNYAACYIVHETSPAVYGAPPINPMSIDRGSASTIAAGTSDATALSTACNGFPAGPNPVPVSAGSLDISKNNFVDNRSGPVETVSSLLNAINLKQYVRAYSYFQDPATFPGAYTPYAAGYTNTDTITATFGTAQSEGAAGSLYYKLPLAMKVLTTSSAMQTFVGCYTLRLSQPAVQGVPPFQPLGIVSGKFTQVDNSADTNSLLPTACN